MHLLERDFAVRAIPSESSGWLPALVRRGVLTRCKNHPTELTFSLAERFGARSPPWLCNFAPLQVGKAAYVLTIFVVPVDYLAGTL